MSDMKQFCIVGAACRLPGAPNETKFRDLLNSGAFAVGQCPTDRWHPDLLYHPNSRTPGSAYTFAGGFLPSPYDFDIGVFGMSPREAEQVDPQQRLLAEVVWEALENAWIPPSALAGKEVGVYVGVSALDHANLFGGDPASIESHFMTGNTLSIVANRISYLFDLRGPSFVVDTACSSSLVAVDNALSDLRSGRVDTAIVAGVNMLMSPASFVGFSRAAMLSPTGACRPFSAQADGYVRSEGAVAFVLQRKEVAASGAIRAFISGSAVNSDGRTSGIALPGLDGQCSLLERAYADAGITAEDLSFVEAHGTGTAVGDPIEAEAIGTILGQRRSKPLPIGSVKSNIGHLEPASGVAGMMKSIIAMEQRRLPATLHLETINPDIPFETLNLQPASESIELGPGVLHCGISSFGFGGTNAHVILSRPPLSVVSDRPAPANDTLILSAQCKASLAELAKESADRLAAGVNPLRYAAAVADARPLMRQRAVLPVGRAEEMVDELRAFAAGKQTANVQTGSSLSAPPEICFVYNGNGSQWVGMGKAAYRTNNAFAHAFDQASEAFQSMGYASLVDEMHANDLGDRIGCAACAQSLIFAIQVGISSALSEKGMRPAYVLGHSVGEIAAAYSAGIIDLDQSARILAARAKSQEVVRGSGSMATLAADRMTIAKLIDETGLSVGIAADNALTSVTISGRSEAVAEILRAARSKRIAGRMLEVEYPYHCELLDGIKESFLDEVGPLAPFPSKIAMISTVTGQRVHGHELDLPYWWQNIRSEVLFRQAIKSAAEEGATLFVEIGCRAILSSAVAKSIEDSGFGGRVIHSLSDSDTAQHDPIGATIARAIANGFEVPNAASGAGEFVDRSIDLPSYPWQRETYRYTPSSSAIDIHGSSPRHPLIGARISHGTPEWRSILDAELVPYLADHILGGEIVVPGTALAEMALAVAREIWPTGAISVEDFDIVQAMVIPAEGQREVSVRYSELSSSIEIFGRLRLSDDDWTLFARGRIAKADDRMGSPPSVSIGQIAHRNTKALYGKASDTGIDYGPAFRLFRSLRRDDDEVIEVSLALPTGDIGKFGRSQIVSPASLDAAFHGLFDLLETNGTTRKAWLPIRFERLTIWRDNASITSATLEVNKSSDHLKTVSVWLFDDDGSIIGRLDHALLRPVVLSEKLQQSRLFYLAPMVAGHTTKETSLLAGVARHFEKCGVPRQSDGWLLLRAHMRAAVHKTLLGFADESGALDLDAEFDSRLLAAKGQTFLVSLFEELGKAGLVKDEDGKVILSLESGMPEAETILATFAEEYPLCPTDLALSAHAAACLAKWLVDVNAVPPRPALVERNSSVSLRILRARDALINCVMEVTESMPGAPLHIVVAQENGEAIIQALSPIAGSGGIRLSIAAPDSNAAERAARRLSPTTNIEIIDLSTENIVCADLILVLAPSADHVLHANTITSLAALLRSNGIFVSAQLERDNISVFQRGPELGSEASPVTNFATTLQAEAMLTEPMSFVDEHHDLVITALRRDGEVAKASQNPISIQVMHSARQAAKKCPCRTSVLRAEGLDCREIYSIFDSPSPRLSENTLYIVDASDDAESLTKVLAELRDIIVELPSRLERSRLWIVAVPNEDQGDATSSALRSFARVAMNEQPECDIRFIEISRGALDE